MGNASGLPSFSAKKRSTPNISTSTSHWTGYSNTHHLGIWLETGGLNTWPNYPLSVVPSLSTIKSFYLVDMISTLVTAPLVTRRTKISNPLFWSQATLLMTIRTTMSPMQTRSLFTTVSRRPGYWSMGRKQIYLVAWSKSWWKRGMHLRCPLETTSGTDL